jgi:hypothetical protein
MVLWGLVSLLVAEVQNYHQLLAVRLILGIFEAVFVSSSALSVDAKLMSDVSSTPALSSHCQNSTPEESWL